MINSKRIFTNDELNMVHSFALEFFEYNPPSRKKLAELISTIMDVSITSIYKYM